MPCPHVNKPKLPLQDRLALQPRRWLMLTGHTWAAIQHRLAGFSEGQNVATEYRWAGRQERAAALRWKRDDH